MFEFYKVCYLCFNYRNSGGVTAFSQKFAQMTTEPNAPHYNMNMRYRGFCLIFNHRHFEPNTNLGERNGTNRDRDQMKLLFQNLGYDVQIFDDRSVKEIKNIIEDCKKIDFYLFPLKISVGICPLNCILIYFGKSLHSSTSI